MTLEIGKEDLMEMMAQVGAWESHSLPLKK
jgi:hypothetical protein